MNPEPRCEVVFDCNKGKFVIGYFNCLVGDEVSEARARDRRIEEISRQLAPNTYALLPMRHRDASPLRLGSQPTSVTHKERKGEELTNKTERNSTRIPAHTQARTTHAHEALVEEIYSAYPKKVGKPAALRGHQECLSTFRWRHASDEDSVVCHLRNGDLDYVPHPATWFTQERFNDDPSTWKPRPKRREFGSAQDRQREIDDLQARKNEAYRLLKATPSTHSQYYTRLGNFNALKEQLNQLKGQK